MPAEQSAYVAYPEAVMYEQPVPGSTRGKKAVQHLIWGDWLAIQETQGNWRRVKSRGQTGWLHRDSLQSERVLEVNFVDIGQGDGCLIVTPEDRFILVDAGAGDNMVRFLRWRFGHFRKVITFEAAVITHPDADHYYGFKPLLDDEMVRFQTIYHNGIVERAPDVLIRAGAASGFGPTWQDPASGQTYLTDVIADLAALRRIVDAPARVDKLQYPLMLKSAASSGRVGDIRMLCADDGYVPGYEAHHALSIQVLAPIPQPGPAGERALRWFVNDGKTKNGNSIVLRLVYRDVSVILGGDLNIPAEEYLLSQATGLPLPAETEADEQAVVAAGRRTFESDVLKACHHGSADFTDVFLRAINPLAVVVSSGDAEPHCHPRPDTLGALGRNSRGPRPLIFSTELARSSEENIKHPYELRQQFLELQRAVTEAQTAEQKQKAQRQFERAVAQLERSVAVYGMICLRTDGHRVLFAQKLERPRSKAQKWDLHRLEPGPDNRLRYVSESEE